MTTEAPPVLGFERIPDTFGGYRWDGGWHTTQFTSREAKRLIRSLQTALKEEVNYRHTELVRKGLRPYEADSMLGNTLCLQLAKCWTFTTGSFDTSDLSAPKFVDHGAIWVDSSSGKVMWKATEETLETSRVGRHSDPTQEINSMLSGSWMGRVLYEHIAAAEVRSAK